MWSQRFRPLMMQTLCSRLMMLLRRRISARCCSSALFWLLKWRWSATNWRSNSAVCRLDWSSILHNNTDIQRYDNNNNNTVISIALFTDRPGALTTSDVCSTKYSVLRRRLKRPVSLIWWRWRGRLFHAVGPAWEKPRSPTSISKVSIRIFLSQVK